MGSWRTLSTALAEERAEVVANREAMALAIARFRTLAIAGGAVTSLLMV